MVNEEEAKWLELSWNELCDGMYTDNSSAIHPPPALAEAAGEIAVVFLNRVGINADNVDEQMTSDAFHAMMAYGAAMFHFGQHTMQRGLLHANLTQCDCLEVTDDDIKAFYDGVAFANEKPEQPNA